MKKVKWKEIEKIVMKCEICEERNWKFVTFRNYDIKGDFTFINLCSECFLAFFIFNGFLSDESVDDFLKILEKGEAYDQVIL